MRTIFLALVILTFASNVFSQRDILKGALQEYGTNLKYIKSWTDDEYIVMLAKGTIEKSSGYTYLFIHPEKGVVSTHAIKSFSISPLKLVSTSTEKFTVYYSTVEKVKTIYYSVSFSKQTNAAETQVVSNEIKDAEKESMFSFIMNGRTLFASASKDKTKFAFRELTSTGEASVAYEFNMPDTLMKALNLGLFDQDFDRRLYVTDNNVKMLVYRQANKMRIDVFDFDLAEQKLKINTYQEKDGSPFAASFSNNHLFVIRTGVTSEQRYNTIMKFYELSLDILEYPSFKNVKTFKFDKSNATIPFKTSALNELTYKSGLYFNGNFKFIDHENEFNSMGVLKSLNDGIPFMRTKQSRSGNYLLEIGSQEDVLVTNVVTSTINRFFGCMDINFEPCKEQEKERISIEKALEYLKSVQKEDPEFTAFGYNRTFIAFYFKKKKEILIKEF